jgi:hypothetical protein
MDYFSSAHGGGRDLAIANLVKHSNLETAAAEKIHAIRKMYIFAYISSSGRLDCKLLPWIN